MRRFQKKRTRTLHDVWFLTFIFSGSKQDPRQSRDIRTLFRSKWKIGYYLSLFVMGFSVLIRRVVASTNSVLDISTIPTS